MTHSDPCLVAFMPSVVSRHAESCEQENSWKCECVTSKPRSQGTWDFLMDCLPRESPPCHNSPKERLNTRGGTKVCTRQPAPACRHVSGTPRKWVFQPRWHLNTTSREALNENVVNTWPTRSKNIVNVIVWGALTELMSHGIGRGGW